MELNEFFAILSKLGSSGASSTIVTSIITAVVVIAAIHNILSKLLDDRAKVERLNEIIKLEMETRKRLADELERTNNQLVEVREQLDLAHRERAEFIKQMHEMSAEMAKYKAEIERLRDSLSTCEFVHTKVHS